MSKIDVVDMIISVLREHEKALDFKIDALDGVIADLKQQTEKIGEILEAHAQPQLNCPECNSLNIREIDWWDGVETHRVLYCRDCYYMKKLSHFTMPEVDTK